MVIEKIKQTIERENLIENKEKILVALSGGPDSVCLLHALKKLETYYNIKIYAAHLNHKIRGIEAQKDALYAAKLCDELGIQFFVKAVDVPAYAKETKTTLEEAARHIRYNMLFEVKNRISADKIAVAHNLDDQAETVLMRLIRGTGITGLKGMDYKREDGVIRPLMDTAKVDIVSYCESNNLLPRIDHTNLETEYTRNKIRLKLLPYIEQEFSPHIKDTISRMANVIREDSDYLDNETQKIFDKEVLEHNDKKIRLDFEELKQVHPSLAKRLIRLAIKTVVGNLEGIENVHIEDVLMLIKNPKNQLKLNLPKGLMVYKTADGLIFTMEEISFENKSFNYILKSDGYIDIDEIGMHIEAKVMTKERCMMLPTGQYTKAFDIDKVKGELIVRSKLDGDRMKPMGLGGTKKLKDIFIDMKIPREKRNLLAVLSDDNGILWVVGHKISEDYKIDENTKKVLRISCKTM